jgi:hypothetical protein
MMMTMMHQSARVMTFDLQPSCCVPRMQLDPTVIIPSGRRTRGARVDYSKLVQGSDDDDDEDDE